jgi:hypothetical protein
MPAEEEEANDDVKYALDQHVATGSAQPFNVGASGAASKVVGDDGPYPFLLDSVEYGSFVDAIAKFRANDGFDSFQEIPEFPGLHIGPRLAAMNSRALLNAGITHVLSTNGQHPFGAFGRGKVRL